VARGAGRVRGATGADGFKAYIRISKAASRWATTLSGPILRFPALGTFPAEKGLRMNDGKAKLSMRSQLKAILVGLCLGLMACSVSFAKSEFVHFSIEPLWPETGNPGTVLQYKITVVRVGQGLMDVNLTPQGLPEGAVVSFSVNVLHFVGRSPETNTCTMTITCIGLSPVDNWPFTIRGDSRDESFVIQFVPLRIGTETQPTLVDLQVQPDGTVQIHGLGVTGQDYQIEATEDLANPNWTPVGTSIADGNGRFTFIDADVQAGVLPMRFYRAFQLGKATVPATK